MKQEYFPIVPFNPALNAAQSAFMVINQKREQGKSLPEHPYAKYFFKTYFGSSTPTSNQLRKLGCHIGRDLFTKRLYVEAFDGLISSDGRVCPYPLGELDVKKIYPWLIHARENRVEQRIVMRVEAETRATNKAVLRHEIANEAINGSYVDKVVLALNTCRTPEDLTSWWNRMCANWEPANERRDLKDAIIQLGSRLLNDDQLIDLKHPEWFYPGDTSKTVYYYQSLKDILSGNN